MGVLKLISDGTIYEDNLDTATSIDVDGSAGIYPAFYNALRDYTTLSNITEDNITEGKIILNVPTGQTFGYLQIPNTTLITGAEYNIYVTSSIALKKVNVFSAASPYTVYYTDETISSSYFGSFTVSESADVRGLLEPQLTDLDTDIEIEYTIVPKGYPKLQSWAGSQLTASLDSDVQSISFSYSDWYNATSTYAKVLNFNSAPYTLVSLQGRGSTLLGAYLRIYYSGGYHQVIMPQEIPESIITITKINDNILVYINDTLSATYETYAGENFSEITTDASTGITCNISQLITSTEESTGYPAGSTIQVSPTCKLGLLGSEIDLPEESRTLSSHNRIVKELESESANATLHTQFIATKERLSINYDVITEANTTIIRDIEALQWDNNSRLNYITNEESGKLTSTTVKATVTTGGNRIMKGDYYNSGLTIELKEA